MAAKTVKTATYAEALEESRQSLAHARLHDPGEHFPYKLDDALTAAGADVPAGPRGPDDESAMGIDFMTAAIAQASAGYVAAQAAHLSDPSDPDAKADYDAAAAVLVAARCEHRTYRDAPTVTGVPQRARRAGE